MLLRLWWKEGRDLAPIAATVTLAAILLQWFLHVYGGDTVRNGLFIALGLGWAILYALVAATASFAGERENRMLGLLDALPVARSTLWMGKATFALVSSVALAFVLALVGEAGTTSVHRSWYGNGFGPRHMVLVLIESVAWGLLWSSLCRTAIAAGIGAVVSVGVISTVLPIGVPDHPATGWAVPAHVLLLIGAAGASRLILTREGRPRTGSSPIVIRRRPRVGPRELLGTVGPGRAARPRRTILPTPAFYRLVWQANREAQGTWFLTLAVGVVVTFAGLSIFRADGTNAAMTAGLLVMAVLVQGVSVFGLENANRSRSFLDHQAVPPGTIWAAKVVAGVARLVVSVAVVLMVAVLAEMLRDGWRPMGQPSFWEILAILLALTGVVSQVFGVGLIVGMVFRRRVTATLMSLLALIVVATPQIVVLESMLAPFWAAAVGPAVMLGISRGWAADWVGDRGGIGRWLRLAGLVVVPSLLVSLAYIGGRAFGIADIGPQGTGPAMTTSSTSAEEARTLARRVEQVLISRDEQERLAQSGWAAASPATRTLWKEHKALVPEAIALARSAGPIDFGPSMGEARSVYNDLYSIRSGIGQLLMLDALERRSRGDFAGAWEDILAQVRLGDRFAAGAWSTGEYHQALIGVESAVLQGVAWASDPKVPLAALDAARASLREVEAVPGVETALRHEADWIERRLDRPTEVWLDELAVGQQADPTAALTRIYNAWFVAPSWERERTRRIARLIVAQNLANAQRDRTSPHYQAGAPMQGGSSLRTPLAERSTGMLLIGDSQRHQSRALRQMLDLFCGLRAWQLTHGGHSPARLAELFGGDPSRVPADPLAYQPRPFGYHFVSEDQDGPTRILSSVGPDGQDNGGRSEGRVRGFETQFGLAFQDIVFALPPDPPAPKAPGPAATAPELLPTNPFNPGQPPANPNP